MSMAIDVRINSDTISTVRIANTTGHMGADDVNTYEWAYFGDGRRKLHATVEHRYGDGAMVLASKVLAEIALRYEIAAGLAADTPDAPKISPEDAQPQESATEGERFTLQQEFAAADYLEQRLTDGDIPAGAGWCLDLTRCMIRVLNGHEPRA